MCALEHTFLVTPLIVRESLASALVTDSRHHRQFEGQMTSLGFGLENTDLNSKQTQNVCPYSILLLGISESGLILIHIHHAKTKKVSLSVSHLRIYYLLIFNYHSRHWRTAWYFIASCASIHSAPLSFLSFPLSCQRCSFALPNFFILNFFIHVLVLHSSTFGNENNNVLQLY